MGVGGGEVTRGQHAEVADGWLHDHRVSGQTRRLLSRRAGWDLLDLLVTVGRGAPRLGQEGCERLSLLLVLLLLADVDEFREELRVAFQLLEAALLGWDRPLSQRLLNVSLET